MMCDALVHVKSPQEGSRIPGFAPFTLSFHEEAVTYGAVAPHFRRPIVSTTLHSAQIMCRELLQKKKIDTKLCVVNCFKH
jgi:hypothetical protein